MMPAAVETTAGGPSALGILTKLESAPTSAGFTDVTGKLLSGRSLIRARRWIEQIQTEDARMVRFAQLAFLREHLPAEFRTRSCLGFLRFDQDFLSLLYSHQANKARFHGAAVCGSVWACPVCAERITANRRKELKKLLALTEYRIVMVTLTLSHHRGEELAGMVDDLNHAVRRTKTGRAWRRFEEKWGLQGHIYALEVTYGRNGWHPHRHEIFVLDPGKFPGKTPAELKELYESEMQAELFDLYHAQLNKAGRDCDEEHGCVVSANRRDYGDYIEKWGCSEELTRSTRKEASGGGRSVWELLTAAVNGDAWSWALYLEYARAFKGKKQLHWSKGLRDLLVLPAELSDQEAAETGEEQENLIAAFSQDGLFYLRDHDLYGPVIRETERVKGDIDLVMSFLARMGLHGFIFTPEQMALRVGVK